VIILADFGADVQHYRRQFAQLVFPRPKTCPRCAADDHLIGHGSYSRHVCDHNQALAIRVKRLLCTACRHTVALLPSFCLPHRHYLAAVIQRVLDLRFQRKASWATIRRHFAPAELPAPSTCRAWVNAFARVAEHALATLLQQLATWQQQLGKLELLIAELGALPAGPQQLVAAVPHLVACLQDTGISLPQAVSRWLATLSRWGQAAKLGRMV
jgi:hypothetical protein